MASHYTSKAKRRVEILESYAQILMNSVATMRSTSATAAEREKAVYHVELVAKEIRHDATKEQERTTR